MPRLADALHRAPNPPPRSRLRRPLPVWLQQPLGAGALTLGVHALILLWLLAGDRQSLPAAAREALLVEWIALASVEAPIPPMPIAPARTADARVRSAAVTPARSPQPTLEVEEATAIDTPPAAGPARPLSAQLGAFVREGNPAAQYERGPLDRPAQVLPGREEAFVEGFHVREEPSPADVVGAVSGFLFGRIGATCADLRRKMVSDISDAERRKLINDERKLCRRGEAGTIR
jgi:hypothetical protein